MTGGRADRPDSGNPPRLGPSAQRWDRDVIGFGAAGVGGLGILQRAIRDGSRRVAPQSGGGLPAPSGSAHEVARALVAIMARRPSGPIAQAARVRA